MFESLKKKIGGWFKKEPEEGMQELELSGEEEKVSDKKKGVTVVGAPPARPQSTGGEKLKKEDKEVVVPKEKKVVKVPKEKLEDEKPAGLKEALEKKKLIEEDKRRKKEEEVLRKKEEEEKTRSEEDKAVEELAGEDSGGFFAKLARKLTSHKLEEGEFDEFFDGFEMILLENNVALEVVDKIKEGLRNNLVGKQFKKSEVELGIKEALKKAIEVVLIEGEDLIAKIEKHVGVYVIVFCGINGSGKTTSIAKFAHMLKSRGISVVLGAADTFRAASIEQLKDHGSRIGVDVIASTYGADPASVAFDAVQHATKHKKKVVLIDTAGRMHTAKNLMKEMEKIVRVAKPDLKIFVGESITGNDVVNQAREFNESIGIDGVILAKADVDEKSGAVLSVGYVTGKPVYYLGVGQRMEDLKRFDKKDIFRGLGIE